MTSWKCDQGYQSVDKRTESVAECTADGSWSMDGGSSMLSCIRVRCERPITEQPVYSAFLNRIRCFNFFHFFSFFSLF